MQMEYANIIATIDINDAKEADKIAEALENVGYQLIWPVYESEIYICKKSNRRKQDNSV